MVFSSPEFFLVFLPLTVFLYYAFLQSKFKKYIAPFLFLASLVYYAWWRPENVWVILLSILGNYALGQWLACARKMRRPLFYLGIAGNIAALGFYKYTNFAIETINGTLGLDLGFQEIIMPIGISFFTFQQIAYLADIYAGRHDPDGEGFINYCCFVCFFPQLVAGPIVHHQEMMPQFFDSRNHALKWENIFNGIVLFSMGLAKKVLLADQLSPLVRYCFDQAGSMTFPEALIGSLCFTLQLYFDFSAYCDMAIGSALFFNINLPWNFNSPYKALSIQDFWRRWHMTLSRWLRDYLYIPMGGNRKGNARTYGNLFVTFLLGGLWHGAAWTFVIWGALHGLALTIHRLWTRMGLTMPKFLGWLCTFAFINLAWIVFRAPSMERLGKFRDALAGFNGFELREVFRDNMVTAVQAPSFFFIALVLAFGLGIVFLLPNSRAMLYWHPRLRLCLAVLLASLSLFVLLMPQPHPEFIYSNF